MSVYKIIVDGPFFFGNVIEIGNGDTDQACSFCGDLCTYKSSCSNRYSFIQGTWDVPPDGVQVSKMGPDMIPICDKCYEHHNIGDYGNSPNIIVFYNKKRPQARLPTFLVDCNFRTND